MLAPYLVKKIKISNNRKEVSHQGKICIVHTRSCPSDVSVFVSPSANWLVDTEAPTRCNDTTIRCELQLMPTVNWYSTPPRHILKISNDLLSDIIYLSMYRNYCTHLNDIDLFVHCNILCITHSYVNHVRICHTHC